MYGYIYLVTNLINLKKYLGKHKYDKPEIDSKYFGSGTILAEALQKYGKQNFKQEILEPINGVPTICDTEYQLNLSEQYYIDYYHAVESDEFYNILPGGQGGNTWQYLSEDQKQNSMDKRLNTLSQKEDIDGRSYIGYCISKGKQNQPDDRKIQTSNNISRALTGLKKSSQHCQNISQSRKEKKVASGDRNPNYNKICVYKQNEEIHIYEYELPRYLELGYIKGRPNCVNEKAGLATRGTKWYHNDIESIRIKDKDIDYYESIGYVSGRLKK